MGIRRAVMDDWRGIKDLLEQLDYCLLSGWAEMFQNKFRLSDKFVMIQKF